MPNERDTSPISIVRILTRLNIGGPSIHVALLCAHLDPERFSTCLVAGQPDAQEGDLSELVHGPGVRVIRVNTLHRSIHPWADLVSWCRLLRILWTERPRLIHTHMAKAGTLGRLAGILYNGVGPGRTPQTRARLVHTFHGHVLDGYFPRWRSHIFMRIERWLARRTDCLIAVSQTVRNELLAKGIGRSDQWRVVPLGLELSGLSQLAFSNGSSPIRCGMVGRLVPIKNPQLFLHALARLRRQQPALSVSGVIVGDGPLRDALEREAQQSGLRDLVQFTGWQRNVARVYEGLDVVCLTSWNEGTPVSLIEAMAAGRAVIAAAVGGVPDLLEGDDHEPPAPIVAGTFRVTERGVLVRPGDAHGLAAALAEVAGNPTLRAELGQRGRAHVMQRFRYERLLEDMTALYEALESGRQRS